MKLLLTISLCLSVASGLQANANGLAQSKALKAIESISKTYEKERKNPVKFGFTHFKDKKYAAQLSALAKKYNVTELLPAKFDQNKITLQHGKNKMIIEVVNAATGKIRVNSYEYTFNSKLSAQEQMDYLSKVLRKTGYTNIFSLFLSVAKAEEDEAKFQVSFSFLSYIWFDQTFETILEKRNELNKNSDKNIRLNISCEPRRMYFEKPYNSGHLIHEISVNVPDNNTANNEYSQIADKARAMGFLADHSGVSVSARSKNTFTGEEFKQSYTGSIDDGELLLKPGSTTTVDTLASYNRLEEKEYVELAKLLQTCCAEKKEDCQDKVNNSQAGTTYKSPDTPSKGSR